MSTDHQPKGSWALARRLLDTSVTICKGGVKVALGVPAPTRLTGMTLDEDDSCLAAEWLKKRALWTDPKPVRHFEQAFGEWNGSRFARSFGAGRKALSAGIHALRLGPGDEVILPGFTCVLVPNAFRFAGVAPIYCDIELDTYGPDVQSVASRITPRTKALFIQHLFGLVCRDYLALIALAKRRNLLVIEDCAQATGAVFEGQKVGTRGDIAFYSSEVSKLFNTIVGGIAVTNSPALAQGLDDFSRRCSFPDSNFVERQLKTVLRTYAERKHPHRWLHGPIADFRYSKYDIVNMSPLEVDGKQPVDYYTLMSAPAAALAAKQLLKLDKYNSQRRGAAGKWDQWCGSHGYSKPVVISGSQPVYLRYPVLVEPQKKTNPRWAKQGLGVELGVWFRTHIHPSNEVVRDCPNADEAVARCVNFPTLFA
jgi:perosamine synthetase